MGCLEPRAPRYIIYIIFFFIYNMVLSQQNLKSTSDKSYTHLTCDIY